MTFSCCPLPVCEKKLSQTEEFDLLRKRLRIRSVLSVNYNYITVLCPFNLLIRFKCYSTVAFKI